MAPESAVLVRFNGCLRDTDLLLRAATAGVKEFQRIELNQAVDGSMTYVYFWAEGPDAAAISVLESLSARWQNAIPDLEGFEAVRLQPIAEIAGASADARVDFHYVVETDVDEENAREFAEWYASEHLPGLAAVPGNIFSRRLNNLDGSPRSFACYDLVRPEALEHPAWLAIRHSPWSNHVRPMYRNTRRTMFHRIATLDL